MLDSVLRVFGETFDVESFLAAHTLSTPVEYYQKGEADILGNANLESGFDAFISEAVEVAEHLNDIYGFLVANEALFNALKTLSVDCVIDIGCMVGEDDQSTPAIRLPVDLLGLCHRLNVAIEVSSYSTSGE